MLKRLSSQASEGRTHDVSISEDLASSDPRPSPRAAGMRRGKRRQTTVSVLTFLLCNVEVTRQTSEVTT